MATISSSWMTSSDPVTTKQRTSTLSPWWKTMLPGAQWLRLKCTASALRHPSLANRNEGCSVKTLRFRWTQMSAFRSEGQ